MTDTPSIVAAYRHRSDQSGAIATVVKTQGSSYRRPGARMLIFDREVIGSISGGCLEQDVIAHAQEVMRSGQPRLVTYDSTAKEDIVWGLGLGCNGVVQILIERLHPQHSLTLIESGLERQKTSILATVFNTGGNVEVTIGSSLLVTAQNTIEGNISESSLKQSIVSDALMAMNSQQPTTICYQDKEQFVEVLFEILQPPVSLWLFGAGQDAVPLAHLAKTLGWSVTLVDCRSLAATAQRFPRVDRVILTRREQVTELSVPVGAIAVVMTHHYLDDLAILKMLLPSPAQYVGLLGSQLRANRLFNECNLSLTEEQQARFYAPIGLDIGAETPEAIAVSIVAEIQSVLARRSPGHLKHRQTGIHNPIQHQERSEVLGPSLIQI
jgi:xanthine dehydrogenase accessory factor